MANVTNNDLLDFARKRSADSLVIEYEKGNFFMKAVSMSESDGISGLKKVRTHITNLIDGEKVSARNQFYSNNKTAVQILAEFAEEKKIPQATFSIEHWVGDKRGVTCKAKARV